MKSIKLQIGGMSCGSCANGIKNVLEMRSLAKEAVVNFNSKIADIKFDESKIKKKEIIKAISEIGYKVKELKFD